MSVVVDGFNQDTSGSLEVLASSLLSSTITVSNTDLYNIDMLNGNANAVDIVVYDIYEDRIESSTDSTCRTSDETILSVDESCTFSFGSNGGTVTVYAKGDSLQQDLTVWVPTNLIYQVDSEVMYQLSSGIYQNNEVRVIGQWVNRNCLDDVDGTYARQGTTCGSALVQLNLNNGGCDSDVSASTALPLGTTFAN
eukprot:UN27951